MKLKTSSVGVVDWLIAMIEPDRLPVSALRAASVEKLPVSLARGELALARNVLHDGADKETEGRQLRSGEPFVVVTGLSMISMGNRLPSKRRAAA